MAKLDRKTGFILIAFELVMIIAFALVTSYDEGAGVTSLEVKDRIDRFYPIPALQQQLRTYNMFQDVQVMILIGFGMLMTFLKKYSYSGVGLNFLICGISFQYAILCSRILGPVKICISSLVDADILTAAVLISMGAVLGKASPLQIIIMTIIEAPLYWANTYLSRKLQVVDVGGSVAVHAFGAYFGLSISKILGKPKHSPLEDTSYQSNLFSIIGTLFLWVFWPSFNGVLATTPQGEERAVINTYLSLLASCVIAFAVSALTHEEHKFTMAHIQNATLAGGVAIGTIADLQVLPWGALLVGGIAGALTTIGFCYIQPWMLKYFGLHDSCGVNNLHGMTAIMAGIAGAIVSAKASADVYGRELYVLFPAMGNSTSDGFLVSKDRTADLQAGYQLLALLITFTIAVSGGTVTGIILKLLAPFVGAPEEYNYDDTYLWEMEIENTLSKRKETGTLETITRSVSE